MVRPILPPAGIAQPTTPSAAATSNTSFDDDSLSGGGGGAIDDTVVPMTMTTNDENTNDNNDHAGVEIQLEEAKSGSGRLGGKLVVNVVPPEEQQQQPAATAAQPAPPHHHHRKATRAEATRARLNRLLGRGGGTNHHNYQANAVVDAAVPVLSAGGEDLSVLLRLCEEVVEVATGQPMNPTARQRVGAAAGASAAVPMTKGKDGGPLISPTNTVSTTTSSSHDEDYSPSSRTGSADVVVASFDSPHHERGGTELVALLSTSLTTPNPLRSQMDYWKAIRQWFHSHPIPSDRHSAIMDHTTSPIQTTCLHVLCRHGYPPHDILSLILDSSPSVAERRDVYGWLPLHYATASGCSEKILGLLLGYAPECTRVQDRRGRTPLHFALGSSIYGSAANYTTIVEDVVVVAAAADNDDGDKQQQPPQSTTTALTTTTTTTTTTMTKSVRRLRSTGLSPSIITLLSSFGASSRRDESHRLPLHYACAYGSLSEESFVALIASYPQGLSGIDTQGRTPLHIAMGNAFKPSSPYIVRILLDYDDDTDGITATTKKKATTTTVSKKMTTGASAGMTTSHLHASQKNHTNGGGGGAGIGGGGGNTTNGKNNMTNHHARTCGRATMNTFDSGGHLPIHLLALQAKRTLKYYEQGQQQEQEQQQQRGGSTGKGGAANNKRQQQQHRPSYYARGRHGSHHQYQNDQIVRDSFLGDDWDTKDGSAHTDDDGYNYYDDDDDDDEFAHPTHEYARRCLSTYLSHKPNPSADFLTALQSLPTFLRDYAVTHGHVQQILNEKIATRFPTAILFLDFYVLLGIIICFTLSSEVCIDYRLQNDHNYAGSGASGFVNDVTTGGMGVEGDGDTTDATDDASSSSSFLQSFTSDYITSIPNNYDECGDIKLYILYGLASYFFIREIVQALSLWSLGSFIMWFVEPKNWLDVLSFGCVFFFTAAMNFEITSADTLRTGAAITLGLLWGCLISFLKSTVVDFAVFVDGVIFVVKRLAAFLLALSIIVVAFAMMFLNLFETSEFCDKTNPRYIPELYDDFPFCTMTDSLMRIFVMLFSAVDEQIFYTKLSKVLYAVYVFLCVLLLFNILIAIVIDSYAVIRNQRAATVFWSNRLDFVAEMDAISSYSDCFGSNSGSGGGKKARNKGKKAKKKAAAAAAATAAAGGGVGGNEYNNDGEIQEEGPSGAAAQHTTAASSSSSPSYYHGEYHPKGRETLDRRFFRWLLSLYEDQDMDKASCEFVFYTVLRCIASIVIPIWLTMGFVTMGILWPPQVREHLLIQKTAEDFRTENSNHVWHNFYDVNDVREETSDIKTTIRSRIRSDREDITSFRTEIDSVRTHFVSDLNQINEIMMTILDMRRTSLAAAAEQQRKKKKKAAAASAAAAASSSGRRRSGSKSRAGRHGSSSSSTGSGNGNRMKSSSSSSTDQQQRRSGSRTRGGRSGSSNNNNTPPSRHQSNSNNASGGSSGGGGHSNYYPHQVTPTRTSRTTSGGGGGGGSTTRSGGVGTTTPTTRSRGSPGDNSTISSGYDI